MASRGRMTFFRVGVVAGDNDGVVDVCAHLNGVDDQVAEEVQRGRCAGTGTES